jgi:hypothetical protein
VYVCARVSVEQSVGAGEASALPVSFPADVPVEGDELEALHAAATRNGAT